MNESKKKRKQGDINENIVKGQKREKNIQSEK
jgi:hypothetical protein